MARYHFLGAEIARPHRTGVAEMPGERRYFSTRHAFHRALGRRIFHISLHSRLVAAYAALIIYYAAPSHLGRSTPRRLYAAAVQRRIFRCRITRHFSGGVGDITCCRRQDGRRCQCLFIFLSRQNAISPLAAAAHVAGHVIALAPPTRP